MSQTKKPSKRVANRTAFRKDRFLSKYLRYCAIGKAATAAGISRRQVDRWLTSDSKFAADFKDAQKEALEILEMEARRRAVNGVNKPIFYKGEKCGAVKEYSDTLLICLLKANAPEKYRERQEITGPNGGPVLIKEVEVRLSGNSG